jgi:hypothetical protein
MFISFAPPKEMNQRKGGRKRQLLLFFAICTKPFPAPKNKEQFATFPVCPRAQRTVHDAGKESEEDYGYPYENEKKLIHIF